MALVAVTGFVAVMFRRVLAASFRDIVTSLADTGPLGVFVLPAAAGITEVDFIGHAAFRDIAAYQVHVSTFGIVRVVSVVLNVGTVTIRTLDVLVSPIVALFVGVAVRTDVEFVRLAAGDFFPATIGAQLIAVTGTQVGVVSFAPGGGSPVEG